MRIIHANGYNERERCSFIPYIHSNTLLAANTLVQAMTKLAVPFEKTENVDNSRLISSQDTSVSVWLSDQVVAAIKCLWTDANVQYVYSRRGEYDLFDSARYLLDSLDRVFSPDYIPSDQDILRVRIPTTGVQESFFKLQSMTFRIVDVGGQKSERKKWIHCFDSVTSIIFFASLCEYDQLLEPKIDRNVASSSVSASSSSSSSARSTNDINTKMEISLALFSTIVSYPGFSKTSFILFLNKKDIFEEKILSSHLSTFYPEYSGPKCDPLRAREFIRDLYLSRSSMSVFCSDVNVTKKPPLIRDQRDNSSGRGALQQRWRHLRHQQVRQVNSNSAIASNSLSNCNSSLSTNLSTSTSSKYSHGHNIYTHFTAATDTENIRLVFASVKDTILRRNIEDYLL